MLRVLRDALGFYERGLSISRKWFNKVYEKKKGEKFGFVSIRGRKRENLFKFREDIELKGISCRGHDVHWIELNWIGGGMKRWVMGGFSEI